VSPRPDKSFGELVSDERQKNGMAARDVVLTRQKALKEAEGVLSGQEITALRETRASTEEIRGRIRVVQLTAKALGQKVNPFANARRAEQFDETFNSGGKFDDVAAAHEARAENEKVLALRAAKPKDGAA